jgi:hypothetical protein
VAETLADRVCQVKGMTIPYARGLFFMGAFHALDILDGADRGSLAVEIYKLRIEAMRSIATLASGIIGEMSDADLAEVARTVAELKARPAQNSVGGDP